MSGGVPAATDEGVALPGGPIDTGAAEAVSHDVLRVVGLS